MKRLLLLLLLFPISLLSLGQDIPLFSQKLTNSFLYNPALAGHTFGSITTSYRSNYNNVKDAPQNFFLSMHTPFSNHRFGAGFNIYHEQVAVVKNTYYSAAFAYHLYVNKFSSLSMGVGAELNQAGTNTADQAILTDPVYINYQSSKPDFSFGLMYQSRFIKMGISANRLATALSPAIDRTLSNYYTAFVNGMIPIRDGADMLEPYAAYRKLSETNDTYDVGLYYTYNNKITAGAATRKGNIINATLAYRLNQYLLVGYSTEIINNPVGGFVGSSNEITLRYDFNDQNYQKRFRADYKQSIAYRRKSMSSFGKKPNGAKNSKQLAKAQKRVAAFSPNSRYQNTKKLSMGKKSSGKKAPKPKKKKPTGRKGKVNNFKARKR